MERVIISHDVENAKARIKFSHNDVVCEDDFDLKLIIPGSEYTLKEMGLTFTKKLQLTAIDKLTESITKGINDGIIVNPPVVEEATESE
jgi:hypothetical protein